MAGKIPLAYFEAIDTATECSSFDAIATISAFVTSASEYKNEDCMIISRIL